MKVYLTIDDHVDMERAIWFTPEAPKLDKIGFFESTSVIGPEAYCIVPMEPDSEITRFYVKLWAAIEGAPTKRGEIKHLDLQCEIGRAHV